MLKRNCKILVCVSKYIFIRKIIKLTKIFLYYPIKSLKAKIQHIREIEKWEKMGRPVPPPHIIKQKVLRSYASKYHLKVLVETGTYFGDMVEAMKKIFDYIYSIELSKELYERAKERFKGISHIMLIHGDSAKELKKIINEIDCPAIFWLDGHYSGGVTAKGEKDTPIYEELYHILNAQDRGHVIIIDDARCFGKDPAYPTIDKLKGFIFSIRNNVEVFVQEDSIRILPIQNK